MSVEKKPVATVKASFNSKTAAPAGKAETVKAEDKEKKAAVKEEKKVDKKVEKKTAPAKAAAPAAKATAPAAKTAAPAAKAAEKKAEPAKAAAPAAKTTEKKAEPAKKAAPAKKAEPAKAAEKKTAAKIEAEVVLQWKGNDYTYERLLQSAKDVWQYDQGKNVADIKTAQIYVKPENNKAYVVINGTDELSFDI